MIELCLVNALVLYQQKNPQQGYKRTIHRTLAIQLAQAFLDKNAESRQSPFVHYKSNDDRLLGKHFPTKHQDRGRCAVCALEKKGHNVCRFNFSLTPMPRTMIL